MPEAEFVSANYMVTASYPNGFFVVDKGAIDAETKAKIESQGFMVIEKSASRSVEVLYTPRQQVQYYPQQPAYPQYPGLIQAMQNINAQGAA